ncbi:oxidoreductase, partial [Pseudomonas syringae pv. pisi str. 1704B]
KPWRALDAEQALIGQRADLDTFTKVAALAMKGSRAYEHNAFKIPLGQQVIVRNLRDLTA